MLRHCSKSSWRANILKPLSTKQFASRRAVFAQHHAQNIGKTNALCSMHGLSFLHLRHRLQEYLIAAGRRLQTRYTTKTYEEEPQGHFSSTEDSPSRRSKGSMETWGSTISAVKAPSLTERSICQSLTFGGEPTPA